MYSKSWAIVNLHDNKIFRTQGGVHIHDDQVTVTAPTIMWVKVRLYPGYKVS